MADPVAERQYLGRIVPGMDVCDVTGEKVGSVAHVLRFDDLTEEKAPNRTGEEIIEVKSGLFGLGSHYYIPIGAVQEVLTDSLFISKSKEAFEELGYKEKPAHLAELH
ncbi:MAG: DUF2171 domain-containing protein [Chloroflexota bacterium]